jgi:PAS domain-containing protein
MIYRLRTNKDGALSIEYCHYNGEQRIHPQEISVPVFDDYGKIIKTVGTTREINHKKRAEEDLRQSHALFQQAEAISNMGHFCWDLVKDRLISCSDQYARIFDMTVQEALDCFTTTDSIINLIVPKDKETFKKSIDLYSKLTKAYDVEFQITTRLGNKRNLFSRRQYSYDIDGLPLLTFGTIHDNTTEKVKELP